LAPNWLD